METVSKVSALARISKLTLQYYDRISLLCPSARSEAGYRLYSDADLERLQQVLLFRELEFPLAEICKIMCAPGYDRTDALQKQIEMPALKSLDAAAAPIQSQVKRLPDFITEHCYTCSDRILSGLGKMHSGGGALSESLDEAGGEGTALLVARAIDIYCASRS